LVLPVSKGAPRPLLAAYPTCTTMGSALQTASSFEQQPSRAENDYNSGAPNVSYRYLTHCGVVSKCATAPRSHVRSTMVIIKLTSLWNAKSISSTQTCEAQKLDSIHPTQACPCLFVNRAIRGSALRTERATVVSRSCKTVLQNHRNTAICLFTCFSALHSPMENIVA
jgi:hypothetical protein